VAAPSVKTPKGGSSLVLMIGLSLLMVFLVLGGIGGAGFWLVKSGRVTLPGGVPAVQAAAKAEPVKTRLMALNPLLVNLADEGGAGYLRVEIVVRVVDAPAASGKEEKAAEKGKTAVNEDEVVMRDAALGVLSRETSDTLLAPEGKSQLKDSLRKAFGASASNVKVVDVMFTEFLVQR